MIYEIKNEIDETSYFLTHNNNFNSSEFEYIVKTIRFELSHHVNTQDILKKLYDDYGFKKISHITI